MVVCLERGADTPSLASVVVPEKGHWMGVCVRYLTVQHVLELTHQGIIGLQCRLGESDVCDCYFVWCVVLSRTRHHP